MLIASNFIRYLSLSFVSACQERLWNNSLIASLESSLSPPKNMLKAARNYTLCPSYRGQHPFHKVPGFNETWNMHPRNWNYVTIFWKSAKVVEKIPICLQYSALNICFDWIPGMVAIIRQIGVNFISLFYADIFHQFVQTYPDRIKQFIVKLFYNPKFPLVLYKILASYLSLISISPTSVNP